MGIATGIGRTIARGIGGGALAVALAAALGAATALPASSRAQEAARDTAGASTDSAPETTPRRIGSFTLAVQGGEDGGPETRILVVPDTSSTLNEGARLFFRCRDGRGEIYVAVTDGNLGNAREGAGGQWRFGRRPWSELNRWGANDQGTAAFMPPRVYESFVERGRESDVAEIRIVNLAGVRKRFVFPLDGFTEGTERLGCFGIGGDGGRR